MKRTLSTRLIALLVFVVAFAGMARVIVNDFVSWDDSFTLYNNPRMNPPTAETLRFYWTSAEHGLYMPGTQTVWAALAKVARNDGPSVEGVWLDPRVFHFASVALHATGALVMFLLLRRLMGASTKNENPLCCAEPLTGGDDASPSYLAGPRSRAGSSDSHADARPSTDIAAAIGALLFALHPVQVESVAWTAGMKDVLYGVFALVALWQYVAAVQASASGAARRTIFTHYTLATAAFAWAVLCKPTAMVVPALAVVLHVVVLRRNWREAVRWTAAWWPITLGTMIVARMAQQVTDQVATPPLWARPLIAADALAFYAGKILWPLKLCIDYGRSPIVAQDGGWIYWTWLVPAAIAALLIWRPRRELIAAALLVVLCVAPVLGLTRFMFQFYSTVSDHYLYLAMLGPSLAVAWVAMNHERFARPVAFVLLGLLAVKSFAQAGTWKDDEALFSHTLAVNSGSFVACSNLAGSHDSVGDAHVNAAKLADGMNERAAVAAAAGYRRAAAGHFERARALYLRAIEKRKAANRGVDDYLPARGHVARVCAKLGRHDEAVAHWAAAAEIIRERFPRQVKRDLPLVHCFAATELLAMNRPHDAQRQIEEARRIDPSHPAIAQAQERVRRAVAAISVD